MLMDSPTFPTIEPLAVARNSLTHQQDGHASDLSLTI